MRKSYEIQKDLKVKMDAFKAESDAEKKKALATEVESLTNELNDALVSENAVRALAGQHVLGEAEKKEIKRFSISKFIREASDNKLEGFELEMSQEAAKEFSRSGVAMSGVGIPSIVLHAFDVPNATETGYGAEFKQVTELNYVEALKNALVAQQLGAQYLNNLQGNVGIVRGKGATAHWVPEGDAVDSEKFSYGKTTLTPHRLQMLSGYTKELLCQSSIAVDQMIWLELTNEHAAALDAAVLAGTGADGQPAGIVGDADVNKVTISGTPTFANIVAMESAVGAKNGLRGSLAYVASAATTGTLKTTPQVAGYPLYLLNGGMMNGYRSATSNGVADANIIFGNFNDLIIGQWGGLDLIVDPYSSKGKGIVEVSLSAFHDVALRHPESFAVATIGA